MATCEACGPLRLGDLNHDGFMGATVAFIVGVWMINADYRLVEAEF